MTLRDLIAEKVPLAVRVTPEFKVFMAIVKKQKFQDTGSIRDYIEREMAKEAAWLKANKRFSVQGTMNRWLRRHTQHYDFLKVVRDRILPYL